MEHLQVRLNGKNSATLSFSFVFVYVVGYKRRDPGVGVMGSYVEKVSSSLAL